jgi:hypothetical protein
MMCLVIGFTAVSVKWVDPGKAVILYMVAGCAV